MTLQTSFVQFIDQKKTNINSCLSFWKYLKSKAQLIQFTDQQNGIKKVTWAITDQMKKSWKKDWKVGIELSINDNTKIPQIYTLLQFQSMSKKNCGIYWLVSDNLLTSKNGLKSSKQVKMIFPFMSVLNTLQYKQCLCILTLPKCNT